MTMAHRPLACARCGSQCGIAEDVESYADWGPAVIDENGVVRPQHLDVESGHKHDPHTVRIRACCLNASCRHQWTLRRRFDPSPA